MSHRKLQQEVDRVFKKISEGLEIFDTYYERHENCTNNPPQKDKLESDLKREVKKLQRLREQIKAWQSSPEIKDKDSLLENRRSVEVAMEKYKAVEKASKEKAYSNNSLKKSENLDPQEKERRDVCEYLSQSIEELERQYDSVQVEVDKLILLNKKKKTFTTANEERKNQLKQLQGRFRWHLQQLELALRLVENQELDPEKVKGVRDDINYYIESNMEADFVEDETIYDSLNLTSNEAIAHEVAAAFAAQHNEEMEEDAAKENSKVSKKEQRRLEREAKKAAKASAKAGGSSSDHIPEPTGIVIPARSDTRHNELQSEPTSVNTSRSPSPAVSSAGTSLPATSHVKTKATAVLPSSAHATIQPSTIPIKQRSVSRDSAPESHGHTHIHQTFNGITTSTLKPATIPIRPAGDLRWAAAASQAAEKDKKAEQAAVLQALGLSNVSSGTNSTVPSSSNTPDISKLPLGLEIQKRAPSTPSILTSAVPPPGLAAPATANVVLGNGGSSNTKVDETLVSKLQPESPQAPEPELFLDDYESEISVEDLEDIPEQRLFTAEELDSKTQRVKVLKESLSNDLDLLVLPSGIQDFIMSTTMTQNDLYPQNLNGAKQRTICDTCRVSRLDDIPKTSNPPSPLDAFRSTSFWDVTRCALRSKLPSQTGHDLLDLNEILENFRGLETFSLFYCYYYSITPLEHNVAYALLMERNWKMSRTGDSWYCRHGLPKFTNEIFEIADYKIFNLDDWAVIDKLNYKLDYSMLKEQFVLPTDTHLVQQESASTDGPTANSASL
ncbi:LAME_0A02366g1_1 [Lachancea meyersii CBS 8951]|uniref:General negative regulator of transcription subunit n=1 Tax=Lachancea meyersii CBS 8951 TaxID=1266667 RepID=A0A1G4IMH4_9SACH|nr:LAME_0A02366g1_1 [Lachancea meyersii CBS 8951]